MMFISLVSGLAPHDSNVLHQPLVLQHTANAAASQCVGIILPKEEYAVQLCASLPFRG